MSDETDPISAPWTPEQVAAIERWQIRENVHPLTCEYHGAQALDVTPDALYCAWGVCHYRQTWVPAAVVNAR